MIMNKIDVNVKTGEFWEVNHQDRSFIDMLLEERKLLLAQERFNSTFETARYEDNPINRFIEYLRGVRDQNPVLEIVLSCLHKLPTHGGPFYWEWFDGNDEDVMDFAFDMNRKTTSHSLSSMVVEHRTHRTGDNHPRGDRLTETVELCFRGHGNGEAFKCSFWDFSPRTQDFLYHLKPLLEDMSNGDDLRLVVEYVSDQRITPGSWKSRTDDRLELLNVRLVCGDLVLHTDYLNSSGLDQLCRQVNHSILNIINRKFGNKARKAMFVCSPEETMFHIEYDPKLSSMMVGDAPTEEELMMISIAGYEDEFWLDNLKSFDRLYIKPFNLDEAIKWYQRSIPRFKF